MSAVAVRTSRLRIWDASLPTIQPCELRDHAVLVRTEAGETHSLEANLWNLAPWFDFWRDHPLWKSGTWVCHVDEVGDLGGRLVELLPFHTDMSRYLQPPEFVAIRCACPDSASPDGGENLLLHTDDLRQRLIDTGRLDILEVLQQPRPLCLTNGERPLVPMLPNGTHPDVMRIFDLNMATKGDHLELSPSERRLVAEFLALCHEWSDLITRLRLDSGDWIIFSNHKFLHSRSACGGVGRTTEVCLGNLRAP